MEEKNYTEWNEKFIFSLMKKWKAKYEQAVSVIKLYQRCSKKSETPEDFYYEERSEKIINNQ
jgi:hypothetical protein